MLKYISQNEILGECMVETVKKYAKLVNKINRLRKKQSNINILEKLALYEISVNTSMTPLLLAQELAITPQMVSAIISDLEKRNLIERKLDQHDKRKHNLILTAEGVKEAEMSHKAYLAEINNMLLFIGDENSKKLVEIYEKILQYYSEEK